MVGTLRVYVVAETFKVFCVVLTATLLMITLGGAVQEAVRRGLPLSVMARLLPYLVPESLKFVLPFSILYAVCSVFGKMSADNELLALKSAGLNPLRVLWPVLLFAYVLSIISVGAQDFSASWSRSHLKRVLCESVDDIALGVLRASHLFAVDKLQIVVSDVQGRRLKQAVFIVRGDQGKPAITLTAEEAELSYDKGKESLAVHCRNGTLEMGTVDLVFKDWFVQHIPLPNTANLADNQLNPAELAARRIPRQIAYQRGVIQELEASSVPLDPAALEYQRQRLYRLQAERSRRWANGFACFCFAFVGATMAMWSRSGEGLSVFFLCILPILLLYYPLLVVGEMIARRGFLPPYSVWLADAVMLAAGLVILKSKDIR